MVKSTQILPSHKQTKKTFYPDGYQRVSMDNIDTVCMDMLVFSRPVRTDIVL